MTVLHETAWGKPNLTLDILGSRPDGYHELEMVMISVDLCDRLTLALGAGEAWQIRCDRPDIPTDRRNLCWRAAEGYFAAAGLDPDGLCITIQKSIPAQGGMAGGSSDAAAVLRALNRHYRALPASELMALALAVGSDVPYCVQGGVRLARGRGEVLTPLPPLPDAAVFALVRPDFSVSTPALFRQIDRVGVQRRPDNRAMERALAEGDLRAIAAAVANAFEPPVLAQFPQVGRIKDALTSHGALCAQLTGTGSVVFGLFDNEPAAKAAASALGGWVAHPVDAAAQHPD